jgi:hypothetical protein
MSIKLEVRTSALTNTPKVEQIKDHGQGDDVVLLGYDGVRLEP